jgi:hypothetical protein
VTSKHGTPHQSKLDDLVILHWAWSGIRMVIKYEYEN